MILTINAGSSSLKFALFRVSKVEASTSLVLVRDGLFERIGSGGVATHKEAIESLFAELAERGELPQLMTVAHRVVHGGEAFRQPTLIMQAVETTIESLAPLAPLHNPVNLQGIRTAGQVLAKAELDIPQVAIFDTAFHANLPEYAFRYAVPQEWYEKFSVRKYGFHGTSHRYVSTIARRVLAKAELPHARLVTLHLGNGCSAAAILNGQCIDTTMGLTPLAGLVMGTRSGDVDPGLAAYLLAQGISVKAQDRMLNKASGLLGIAGENDVRNLLKMRSTGSLSAKLALEVFVYQIRKTIGAFAAVLNGLDGIIFTAGIGENSAEIRSEICADMDFLGISLSAKQNTTSSDEAGLVSNGKCAILVVPTNEELAMAEAALKLIK